MSLSMFCPSCGSPNYYTTIKPRFCNNCGSSFELAKQIVKPTNNVSSAKVRNENIEEEGNEDDFIEPAAVPKNIKWQYSTSDVKYKGFKISDLTPGGEVENFTSAAESKSKEEILQEFFKEATSQRKPSGANE